MCPGINESAAKHRSGWTRLGSKRLRKALIEAGQAGGRSKNTYLSAQHAQIRARRGRQRAEVAVGHSILVVAWHLLTIGEIYDDLGADYFDEHHTNETRQRRPVKQLEAIRRKVISNPPPDHWSRPPSAYPQTGALPSVVLSGHISD
jgi:hypothetical protein